MLGLSARVVGFYAAFGYPIALLCAIPYFVDRPAEADPQFVQNRIRTAGILVLLAPLHVLFPLTALGIIRDLRHERGDGDARALSRTRTCALVGVGVSVTVFVALTLPR